MFFGTLLLLFGGTTMAQHLSHQVLVPAAGIGQCSSMSLSQSLGENAVTLMVSENNDLTQGFQQPGIRLTAVDPPLGTGMKVYPVPATDCLNIELYGETARKYTVTLLSISGRVVYSKELDFQECYWYVLTVPVNDFVKGMYFVRVRCLQGEIDRTFKISVI
jgi:hypothetical protein